MIDFNPSISSLSTGITSLLFFLSAALIYRSWKKNNDILLKYFFIFLLSFALQQLFFSLGTGTLSLNPVINSWLWTIAHIFMFIGLSFFIRFPFTIVLPKIEKTIFTIAILYSFMGIAYFIATANQPAVQSKLLNNNIFVYEVPNMHTGIIVIFTTITLISSLVIFIINAIKTTNKFTKWRSILLSVALLTFLTAGPMHNFVRDALMTTIVDGMLVLALLLMVLGVYLKKILKVSNK